MTAEPAEPGEVGGEPDVFESYARLRMRLGGDPSTAPHVDDAVWVSHSDLELVLGVQLAHALTPAVMQRGVDAANAARRAAWNPIKHRELEAAVKAMFGGER